MGEDEVAELLQVTLTSAGLESALQRLNARYIVGLLHESKVQSAIIELQ